MMTKNQALRYPILAAQGFQCFYCGVALTAIDATTDHVIPTSIGGPKGCANQVCACRGCNEAKRNRLPTKPELEKLARIKRIPVFYFIAALFYVREKHGRRSNAGTNGANGGAKPCSRQY